jgi:hypothetical protein
MLLIAGHIHRHSGLRPGGEAKRRSLYGTPQVDRDSMTDEEITTTMNEMSLSYVPAEFAGRARVFVQHVQR